MSDQPPKPHEPMPKPQRTRLVEPVECGLSEEDRATLDDLQWAARSSEEEIHILSDDRRARALDLLDRLPRMVEDRDRELADAEYEVLSLKLEVDTIRQLLADVLARGQQPNYVSMPGLTYPKLPGAYEMRDPMPGEGDVICD